MAKKEPSSIDHLSAKRWLRKFLIKERQAIPASARKKMSALIVKRLVSHSIFKKSQVVASFVGFGSEVITDGIIEHAWKMKKQVLIPIVSQGFDRPYFALFRKGDALQKTTYGPLELAQKKKSFKFNSIDLVLVPGLGFDRFGYRLGYGGGVYDRILKQTSHATHVGLFFSDQKLPILPREKHDQTLQIVITEEGLHRF